MSGSSGSVRVFDCNDGENGPKKLSRLGSRRQSRGVGAAAPDARSDPLACKEVEEQIVKFGRRLHICHVTDARYGDLVGAVNARR
jgi:hypothetical protein